MIKLICDDCGSDKIEFDATAVWNVDKQDYDYSLCDSAWCQECEDIVPIKEIEINESNNN